jgi:hypothetical protein
LLGRWGGFVKKVKAVRVNSRNGETHYILQECWGPKSSKNSKVFDEYELIEITRKDADKRLLITHE